ncbi:NBS-LRR type resistance protein [Cucumis melo var. makuwa]|uniref:NBS-LRR type resistance protein n=1 Tax=Cucumis melo var. makuwa TaxID=1194695 RepID=A0A5A7TWX0_CUCMM|nr:NBS-LRR type resistance protein [Cucumis melo var. makuwa]
MAATGRTQLDEVRGDRWRSDLRLKEEDRRIGGGGRSECTNERSWTTDGWASTTADERGGSVAKIHQRKHKENQTRPYGLHASFLPLAGLPLAIPLPEKLKRKRSRDLEGYTYQSRDPEGCTYQSSNPEGCTYQSRDPEGYRAYKIERGWLGSSQLGWLSSNRLSWGNHEQLGFRALDGSRRFANDARRRSDDRLLCRETMSGGRSSPAFPWLSRLCWLETGKEMLGMVADGKFTGEMDAVHRLEEEGDDGWLRMHNQFDFQSDLCQTNQNHSDSVGQISHMHLKYSHKTITTILTRNTTIVELQMKVETVQSMQPGH